MILRVKKILGWNVPRSLVSLRANHGGQALVGYFPDLMHSRRSYSALKKFLDATYHFLEHDPFQNKLGGIGIVTSPQVAFQLQLDTSRPLRYVSTYLQKLI